MKTYTITVTPEQMKVLKDAVDHLVEVDLEFMDETNEYGEEAVKVQHMLHDLTGTKP